MKKMIWGAVAVLLASLLSACATTEANDKSEAKEERQYVTGSNLPKRDRSSVTVISKEAIESSLNNSASGMPTTTSK